MIFGTAGLTAMSGIMEIINHNITPEDGNIIVSGATGGVGIMALTLLSVLGYKVIASSGKKEHFDLLTKCGAGEIISREILNDASSKPLATQK